MNSLTSKVSQNFLPRRRHRSRRRAAGLEPRRHASRALTMAGTPAEGGSSTYATQASNPGLAGPRQAPGNVEELTQTLYR
eukprot:scaffold41101_cov68-Phaeocystis_antarctica.AAC.2